MQHRADGTLVLRDNRAGRNVWHIGTPVSAPGRLTLLPEGFLVLEGTSGIPAWSSGHTDRRVVAAMVRDDGRLVLVDPDGYPRWSRDALSAEDLAAYRPASGDRLQRGEILADSIVSSDGRYTLTHTALGETMLHTKSNDGGDRRVWSRKVGKPGAAISLGPDGVLRAGTDSTVLQRWTGRFLLDHTSFVVSAVVVRNQGDVVLLDEDGSEIYDSRTAAEEARLAELEREYARREAEEKARPARPAGSGTATGWFDLLDLDGPYTITWLEQVDEREALLRLGAGPETIRPMTYDEAVDAAFPDSGELMECALAVPVGKWVMVIEPNGVEGLERAREMSARTQAIVFHEGFDGERVFAWYQDNEPVAVYQDDDSDLLDSGAPAPEGAAPDAMVPFMRQIGLGVYRQDTGDLLPPPVEIACLIAGIEPGPEHCAGTHLGAVFGTW
ncbi:DUF6461 domain-containing protein [Streptomyces luteolifulvus]|uniref:DUF6461 domain-containing protein n=1 Tax=Streptomyces luteolifulvus TaxID=2615112 RepID=UPI001CD931F8|nr:DUF6461 domain-containing protein [Streptomyces luteolifulvus]